MIVAEKKKALFVHIEKTGGTSIAKLLSPHVIDCHRFKAAKAVGEKGWRESNHINSQHSRFAESLSLLDRLGINLQKYYKFTIVRNPYSWILSIYLNRYGKPMNVANTFKNRLRFNLAEYRVVKPFPSQEFHQLYPNPDFKEFLLFINSLVETRSKSELRRYLGATDQYSYLENERGIEFDFIGKLEQMNLAIAQINEKLNLAQGIEIPHLNQKSDRKARASFLNYYDLQSLELVNKLYKRDFRLFDYQMLHELPATTVVEPIETQATQATQAEAEASIVTKLE